MTGRPPGPARSTSLRVPCPRPRATTPSPATGLLRRGNRNSTDTAPSPETRALWADLELGRGGYLGPPRRATGGPDRAQWRTADEKKRRGRVCPGCGLETPTSGRCAGCHGD